MLSIYGTLGPSCADMETLAEMFSLGMTGVRLNLSHVCLPQAAGQIAAMHEAAARSGIAPQLLIDMQGPELRIGTLSAPLTLEAGSVIMFGKGGIPLPDMVCRHCPGAARRHPSQPEESGSSRRRTAPPCHDTSRP